MDIWMTDWHLGNLIHLSRHYPTCNQWALSWTMAGRYFHNFKRDASGDSGKSMWWLSLHLGVPIIQIGWWKEDPYSGCELLFNAPPWVKYK